MNKQAVLYDENGRQVAADKIDDILEEGGKLYSDREAASEVTDLSLKVDTEDSATAAIDTIAAAIQQVSSQRSALGAIQNRLEHTIANLDNIVENIFANFLSL